MTVSHYLLPITHTQMAASHQSLYSLGYLLLEIWLGTGPHVNSWYYGLARHVLGFVIRSNMLQFLNYNWGLCCMLWPKDVVENSHSRYRPIPIVSLLSQTFLYYPFSLLTLSLPVADPGGFHWFPRKPPFKSEDYFNTYIYAAIKTILKNILCTVTQPFLIN